LHFIFDGAGKGQRGLIASLQENPSQLERIVNGFGWSLTHDHFDLFYRSPVDVYIDQWVHELLATVERDKVERVMIDSLTELAFVSADPQRFREYVSSLIQRLSRRGVSLIMTSELPDVFGTTGMTPVAM